MADNKRVQEQLKEITNQLERGIKEVFENRGYQDYLDVMSRFHNYSVNNTMLIAMQKPDATLVAGFDAWKTKFGRHVKKGEKAISIIAPNPIKATEEVEKLNPETGEPVLDTLGQPVLETVETTQMTFRVAKIFDVSQTDGKELPELIIDELTGEVKDYERFMQVLGEIAPVPIGFEEIEEGYGYYHQVEKRIAIQEGLSELQTMKTTIHEIAHAVLHDIDTNAITGEDRKDGRTREVEAESVAYTICTHYGLDTSAYSFDYIGGWSSGKEIPELKQSLNTIRKTAADLITAIDEKMKVHIQEKQNELQMDDAAEPAQGIELSGDEVPLVYGHDDYFGIYQLKQEDTTRDYRFERMENLQAKGLAITKENYDLVYQGVLKNESLDDIFERFNMNHPADFTGHSLSVSDIVVIRREGETKAHYVDSFGFQEVKDFYLKDEQIKEVEKRNAIEPEQNKEIEMGDAKQSISFYVAECGEFHNMGEYHDKLTLQEAIAIYQTIPSERMNAGKAIGFELQTGYEGVLSDASMELFYHNTIGMDSVEHMEWLRGNELIWDAMQQLAAAFPDADIANRESIERLAVDINAFIQKEFPHEIIDDMKDKGEGVAELIDILSANERGVDWEPLQELIEDKADRKAAGQAQELMQRAEDIWLRRERNPLTKVEELEEGNYNQIDGILNNMDMERQALKGPIHERLEQAKEILAREQGEKPPKAPVRQREELES